MGILTLTLLLTRTLIRAWASGPGFGLVGASVSWWFGLVGASVFVSARVSVSVNGSGRDSANLSVSVSVGACCDWVKT